MSARELITEHLDLWTGAVTQKSSRGRGSNGKLELTGIKKLRELILELAIRGKLVEQCANEEPSKLLLERVKSEKHQLFVEGEIKKPRMLPSLSEMKPPFSPPRGWEWAQLEDIGRDWGQKTPDRSFSYIDVASIDSARGVTTKPSILSANDAPSRARKKVQRGTLIYSTVRPYLQNIAVIDNEISPEPIASTAFAILHPLANMPARFFLHYLRSTTFVRYVESVQTGIAYPAINDRQFFSGVVPIPPVEEQHRIVQKVDELMALCDRLEQQTSDQLEAHETLVDTLLGTLTQSQNATELADNWARLAAHFDTLFTTEQSIDKLKQTILQLAVMGRLVEQDAGDEPATELLKRIQAKKDELSKSSKQRKAKPLPSIEESEKPFPLPLGWTLSRLDDITDIQGGIAKGKKIAGKTTRTLPYLRVANVQRSSLDLSEIKEIEIAEEDIERYLVRQRDLLITEGGDWDKVGRAAIWDGSIELMAHQNHVFRARLILEEQNERWLERYLNSQIARNYFASSSKQTTNLASINKTQLRSCTAPLPPLEEQGRIVQKVEELMTLCDQLKERLNQADETRCQLTETVVKEALN